MGEKIQATMSAAEFLGTTRRLSYTLALALELRKRQLEGAGFHVMLTRSRDIYVDLPSRPAMANHNGADLFISLHFNATPVDKGDISGPRNVLYHAGGRTLVQCAW